MEKGHIILTLTLSLFSAGVAWAQNDQNQQPAPAPVPAFGQENPAPTVSEEPANFRDRPAGAGAPCGAGEFPVARSAFQRVPGL